MNFTFTNATEPETVVPEKVDLEGLNKLSRDWRSSFINKFKSVPVRVDTSLEGGEFYIAISPELHIELIQQNPTEAQEIANEK